SFHCTPGLPILHSKDLVNWTIVNHALKNVPGEQYRQVRHNCGVWAPAIRFHEGRYWIFFPTPDEGIYVTTATDPRGQWSPPHLLAAGKGLIDPCPLWDEDGQAYLVHAYAGSRAGIKNRLRVVPINDAGEFLFEEFEKLLTPRTSLVAVAHVSNALGSVNPVPEIVRAAHRQNVPVLVDGAQAAAHIRLDVQALDCDFYAFSGHKLYAPNGIGVLYGKAAWLDQMPPYQSGGYMIRTVTFEKTTFNELPWKFEAGTPNIAGAIGLGAALDYLDGIGLENAAAWEQQLLAYATTCLAAVPGLRLIGTAREKAAVLSFVLEGVHPHDVATILDRQGVAVRAGHVCAQPVMERFGVPAITRASFAFYNTREEVDALVAALHKVREIFG
ncbi:MAG: aminotransferase class V-fold PLP-dependent enzyme, partial [Bryobacteraceae bacterium]|nr:aminotransferase class V-fold PLP-dependent enzyme [Bryobacteraceae bacterium]